MVDATASAPLSWQILLTPSQGRPIELYDRITLGRATARGDVRVALEAGHPQVDDLELSARLVHLVLEDLVRLHVNAPAEYPRERIARQAETIVEALLAVELRTEGAL